MSPRHFLDVDDLSREELLTVLDLAADYERAQRTGEAHEDLAGRTLADLAGAAERDFDQAGTLPGKG